MHPAFLHRVPGLTFSLSIEERAEMIEEKRERRKSELAPFPGEVVRTFKTSDAIFYQNQNMCNHAHMHTNRYATTKACAHIHNRVYIPVH